MRPDDTEEVIGRIARYRPIRNDGLARALVCAEGVRAANALTIAATAPESAAQDQLQLCPAL